MGEFCTSGCWVLGGLADSSLSVDGEVSSIGSDLANGEFSITGGGGRGEGRGEFSTGIPHVASLRLQGAELRTGA